MLLSIQDYFMQNIDSYGYFGLFAMSFLAATIFPFSSDLIFVGLILAGFNPIICLIVATIGNWLGGMTNYYLGKMGKMEWIEKYLKIKKDKIDKAQVWIEKKGGAIIAFFSWLPGIGDIMAVGLGYVRANVVQVAVFMLLGKGSRYVVELIIIYQMGAENYFNYIHH